MPGFVGADHHFGGVLDFLCGAAVDRCAAAPAAIIEQDEAATVNERRLMASPDGAAAGITVIEVNDRDQAFDIAHGQENTPGSASVRSSSRLVEPLHRLKFIMTWRPRDFRHMHGGASRARLRGGGVEVAGSSRRSLRVYTLGLMNRPSMNQRVL